jgi:long-chain fatty acid transport protein
MTVGAAYQYMNAGDADLDVERGPLAGRLEGDYKSNDFHFFAVNLSWQF